jgi:cobalt-zinc-cadmium efflux system outer membrane protein
VARAGLAKANAATIESERDALRVEMLALTAERFLDAWAIQERIRTLDHAERAAAAAVAAANERLRAGAAPAFERTRAEAFRALREIERGRAEADLLVARRRLAVLWDEDRLAFDSLALETPAEPVVIELDSLLARVVAHPERRRALAMRESSTWHVRSSAAARVPDLTVSAGVRRLEGTDGTGVLAGVELPLPLWNRGDGAAGAVRAEARAAEVDLRAVERSLRENVSSAHERYLAASAMWGRLRGEVVPATEAALDQIEAGYRAGRIGYVEIQDGQRALTESSLLAIDAAADVVRARTTLELLIGAPLSQVATRGGGR